MVSRGIKTIRTNESFERMHGCGTERFLFSFLNFQDRIAFMVIIINKDEHWKFRKPRLSARMVCSTIRNNGNDQKLALIL